MVFTTVLQTSIQETTYLLGYKNHTPDERTALGIQTACQKIEQAVTPRWTFAYYTLDDSLLLQGTTLRLTGSDIQKHLTGCHALCLLGITLGQQTEQAIRAAETADMEQAALLDAAASALTDQYADEAERLLRLRIQEQHKYLTGRFSPGYGNLPLAIQPEVVRLLDGPRAIGLSVSESGILLPRKSITAILGVANHPVQGYLAGCDTCALYSSCEKRKAGTPCGKSDI
ncbi:MAG: methionine synthase [Oscillospiraceae bacterium]